MELPTLLCDIVRYNFVMKSVNKEVKTSVPLAGKEFTLQDMVPGFNEHICVRLLEYILFSPRCCRARMTICVERVNTNNTTGSAG